MSALAEEVGSAVGSVANALGGAVEWIGDGLGSIADFVVDDILEPVANFVGDTISALMDDPIVTIAKIAAVATGNAWAIPLIDGANVAANGGDVGDVLKATATSYVAQTIGGEVGDFAGDYVGEAVGSELVGEVIKEGAVQATTAVIYGEDPIEAFLRGGLTAGISAGLGRIQESIGFEVQVKDPDTGRVTTRPIPNTVSNIVAAGLTAQLTGQEITPELMASAVTRGLLTTELVADLATKGGVSFDDPAALAYTTAAFQRVTAVALSGGSGEQAAAALQATLSAYGGAKLKEAIDNSKVGDFINNTLDKISGDYQETKDAAQRINDIGLRRKTDAESYEAMRTELAGLYEEIEAEKTRIAELPRGVRGQNTEYKKAVAALNTMIEDFDTKYQQYKPIMDDLITSIESDTELFATAEADLLKAQRNMNVSIDRLDDDLKPLNDELTEAVTLVMDPLFNEAEYRAINDLPDSVDAYQHFLENGQYENVYTNFDQFDAAQRRNTSAMMNRVFNEAGIDPSSLNTDKLRYFYNAVYKLYDNPNDLEAALNNESIVSGLAKQVQTSLATGNDNPYFNATLNPTTRAQLAALGFDTSGGMDGEALLDSEKAALYIQDNQGTSTAGLASGTSWQDVASGKAAVEYDENGNRVWRNVRVTEQRYDPEYGRVTVSTSYDSQGRPVGVITEDMDGNAVTPMRINIYGGNNTATFSDTMNGLLQGNASAQQINDALTDNAVVQAAGEQLGGIDNAINFVSNVINLAESTDNDALVNIAANFMKAGGGILKAFNGVVALAGVVPSETALGQFADKLVKLGEASTTEEYNQNLQELNSLMNRPSELDPDAPWYERAFEKVENIAGAIATQPTAFIAEYIVVEAMQELVPLAAGGFAGLGAKGILSALGKQLSARVAVKTSLTTAAITDIAESFGGTAAETYDRAYEVATESGMSEAEAQEYALELAVQTGTVSATMTAVTLGAGGMALEKAILGRDEVGGFLARGIDELGTRIKNGAKITIKEGVTEGIEEGAASAYREGRLAQLDPSINVSGEVAASSFMGFLVGGTVAGGAYGVSQTGDMYSNLVSVMNPEVNAIITDTPNTTRGLQNAANSLTELGITGAAQTNILNNINDSGYTSTQEATSAFQTTNPDYTPTQNEIDQFTVAGNADQILQNITNHIDARYVDAQEVIDAAAAQGVTITQEQAEQYIGQQDETSTLNTVAGVYDQLGTTSEEVRAKFAELGFNPTEAQVNRFVREGNEADILAGINPYVDPRQVTEAEARTFFNELGYNPTDQEVADFVGQGGANFETNAPTRIETYVDPRYFDASEVRAAYEEFGLVDVAQEDVDRFVGQYNPETADYDAEGFESTIREDITGYTPTATFNVIRQYIGSPSVADDPNTEVDESKEATGIYAALEAGATKDEALQGAIDQLSTDLGLTEETLGADIQSVADLVGKPAQDVTQTDIDFVADIIAQNQVLTEQQIAQYDVTGDGIVDINDQTLLEQALGGQQVTFADTSQFTPTGVYGTIQDVQTDLTQQMEQNQEQTLDTIQQMEQDIVTNIKDEAMRAGARNFLQMALQAPDAAGQQVSVKTPDPLELRYIYDWSSIFANPSQEALFTSPYAKGGQVEDTTDKLLNIIGGK